MQRSARRASRPESVFIPLMLILTAARAAAAPDPAPNPREAEPYRVRSGLSFTLTPTLTFASDPWYPEGTGAFPDFRRFYRYERTPRFALLEWETSYGPFSTLLTLPVRKSFLAADTAGPIPGFNLPFDRLMDLDTTFPFRGGVRFATERFGLSFARDRLTVGNGKWSSMTLNAQAPYYDHLRAYYDTGFFRATETVISLNPYLVTKEERTRQDEEKFFHTWDPTAFRERVKTVTIHELSFRLGRLTAGIGELIVIGGRSLQLADANPFLVYHNFYGEDWGNVVAFLNLKYGPAAGVTVYTDLAVDDLTAPTEAKDQSAPPPAFGALLGASWRAEPATGAYIETTLEAAYVSPTFAFRDKPLQGPYARIMYLDNTAGGKRVWVDYPLCYYLGNDLIDGRLHTEFGFQAVGGGRFSGYAGYHFLAKGEETLHGKFSDEGSGIHTGLLPRGTVELTHELEAGLSFMLPDGLSAGVSGSLAFVNNSGHAEGAFRTEYSAGLFVSKTWNIER